MTTTLMPRNMVPPAEVLPPVTPRPEAELRRTFRRIPNLRNVGSVAGVYLQSFGVVFLASRIGHPLAWVAAFLLMGRAHALFGILGHEAAHRLLFSRKRVNDVVGRWVLSYPGFVAFDAYRRVHMAHHRDELGPDEPDTLLYAFYPIPRASFVRKLRRDAFFVSGWKNMKGLGRALRNPQTRALGLSIVGTQVVVAAALTALAGPLAYPLLWLAPWMTVWRVINRLRAIAEHGGMVRSPDKRETTHHVRQGRLARFWMVPFNTGWHLAHHVDSGIPFRNLPRLHRQLVAAGYVVPDLEWRSYRALWRALASGDAPATASAS